jgi:alkanesulfonate monooxygenase SsuD/methylene tetrahydromethanopterin reductase-like flavin-dependent oxidoreductase (luciferase family)
MLTLRFDMRLRDGDASAPALYRAALEMSAWGEAHGAALAMISEHHASSDGYLPAPFVLASAIAARTNKLAIQVAALLVPLHDPIELAEQMAVLDILSGGRVSYICALGYRPEEYAMFGRDIQQRGKRMEACLAAMRQSWSGEAFEYEGRPVRVTPKPITPGGPALFMGGNAPLAVRRAARFGMGMLTMGGNPELDAIYRSACAEYGTKPQLFVNPVGDSPATCFIARDLDKAWREIGPYMLHDAEMYASWFQSMGTITKSSALSVDALRAEHGNYRIFTPEQAAERIRKHGALMLQPLCGGLPPELAWPSLELLASEVLPRVKHASPGAST